MMKDKCSLLVLSVTLIVCGCTADGDKTAKEQFTTDAICPYTPVKDQGQSDACWIYAMLATIESEHIIRGDSVNLSPLYVINRRLTEQAQKRYVNRGETSISLRGTINMLPRLIDEQGLMPYDSYHGETNIRVAERKLTSLTDQCTARRTGIERLQSMTSDLLERELAPVPPHVYMFGVEYTPQEFAHSVCMDGEYVAMTSYTHLPMGKAVDLQLADNDTHEPFINIGLDQLINTVINTLQSGHPVCWEGDISEPGFSFDKGVARLGKDEDRHISQTLRQREYEQFRTTDDHCMELIGLAHDQQGRQYVICKNSWGTNNPYGGLMYMSLQYMRMKTIAVMINTQHLEGTKHIE